jgi:hypothetical protein
MSGAICIDYAHDPMQRMYGGVIGSIDSFTAAEGRGQEEAATLGSLTL